jgi:hypothetical protein
VNGTGANHARLVQAHELASTIRGHVASDRNNVGLLQFAPLIRKREGAEEAVEEDCEEIAR